MGIVNEAFARACYDGRDPVGLTVTMRHARDVDVPMPIVGVVRDTMCRNVRDPIRPIVYVPMTDRRDVAGFRSALEAAADLEPARHAWGGSVFDVDAVLSVLAAGKKALE